MKDNGKKQKTKERITKKPIIEEKKEPEEKPQGYTLFDFLLMFAFVVLVGGMFWLKAREEAFAKDTHKQDMNLKVLNFIGNF